MAYTPRRLSNTAVGTSDTLMYTVPASVSCIIKSILMTNTTATAATVSIGFPAAAALASTNHRFSAYSVPPNDSILVEMNQVLLTTETIRALQGTASAINVIISGVEFS